MIFAMISISLGFKKKKKLLIQKLFKAYDISDLLCVLYYFESEILLEYIRA